jgi:CTP:molybdopterin cytidylyltransferase MocA
MSPEERTGPGAIPFAGLILAGGVGRRSGGPKAFARLPDGRTFLEACRDVLRGAGAAVVAGTLPCGSAQEEVAGLRSLPLPEPGLDMLASARWGLRHLISDRRWRVVVVLPVDHPLVTPEAVRTLVARQANAAVPAYRGKHGHPVCLARDVAEQIAREQLRGDNLRDIMRTVGVVDVVVDDPGVIANCNTPAALRDALQVPRISKLRK